MTVRLLLSCADELFAAGLAALLRQQPDFEAAEERPGVPMTEAVQRQLPDVLVIARLVPDVAELRTAAKVTRIVLLADEEAAEQTSLALAGGVRAVLGAGPSPDELLAAIRLVASGDAVVVPPRLAGRLADPAAGSSAQASALVASLTVREYEVLRLLADGLSNVDIARKLYVSTSTVRSHVHHLLGKLDAKSRAQAVTVAYRAGLIGGFGDAAYDGPDRAHEEQPIVQDVVLPAGNPG